ncbi:MAG TPA: trypsin-like peptidase domain-containing protein [Patescibacteria group bacterium]|nr:trypsin-like peptidase domain-containing protein [Patescibacteria group bacterium]
MSICTFGIYDIYWFYKQWKSFKSDKNLKISPFWRSIFSPIFSYSLFKTISNASKEIDGNKGLEAGAWALIYFFLCRVWPLSSLSLIQAQRSINFYWKKKLGNQLVRSKFGAWNWIVLSGFLGLFIFGFGDSSNSTTTPTTSIPNNAVTINSPSPTPTLESNVSYVVVDILCNNQSAGSGTILTSDGLVLTNNHVIDQATSCIVTLPDSTTGSPKEIYVGTPQSVPGLSKLYDIATVQINKPYTDSSGKTWGMDPLNFATYKSPDTCKTYTPHLGDSIRIYGYPVTSGGYNLTITEGIISSFSNDGYILTSAKVDSGNSGGFATSQDGCWIGIPSAVVSGNFQNLGVIIPASTIEDFASRIPTSQ